MPSELINILVQLPIVGVFVWYQIYMMRQIQDFLREERQARLEQIKLLTDQIKILTEEIKSLTREIQDHDKRVSSTLSVLMEREK